MNLILAAATTQPTIAPGTLGQRGHALFGLLVFVLISWMLGKARGAKSTPWRVMIWGLILQFIFGALVIWSPAVLASVQLAIQSLLDYTGEGAKLVFGNLAGLNVPVTDASGNATGVAQTGAIFAFLVLPTIIFVAMLTAILYHIGVMTWVVHGLAWVMRITMGTSGAETLSTAANIFVGQTEAPLIVKPFLSKATRSELMAIMLGGFANIASGVLVLYAAWLTPYVPDAGGHLALACFISAPATLIVSKLLMPETETPQTVAGHQFSVEKIDANIIDAATRGTSEGLKLAVNVGAMLISFTALIALLNGIIGAIGARWGYPQASLQAGLGYICAPIAWLCGIEWHDCRHVGSLLGIKTVLNELIAYKEMTDQLGANHDYMSPRSALLATYALCGFANFASVGIQIGGISVLAPERRHDLSKLALWAMLGGAIATCMGACVVGVLW